ncbi:MAG: DUF1565 domain-containing protein [Chitinivibrionales bacterium]|nr:DUF1565 domain-containing protein [Chitinivibrionales bacterium]
MKSVSSTLLPLMLSGMVTVTSAAVDVSGTLDTDTQWSDSVNLVGNVTVSDGVTLTLAPGTVVTAQGRYSLAVQGCLLAVGNAGDSVVFRAELSSGWYGIRFINTPATNDSSVLSHCVITGGLSDGGGANGTGGGVHVAGFSKLRVSNSTIRGNTAHYGGGMYLVSQSNIGVLDCVFKDNNAPSTGSAGIGGALYVSNASPTIRGNTITRNVSITAAGICLRNSSALVVDNAITENRVSGIMTQAYDGAGVLVQQSAARLIGNTIAGNSAQRDGGGVCIQDSPDAILLRNRICGNGGLEGGGIYCEGGGPLLSCNLVANNAATGLGGGICLRGASCTILNATIVNNTGEEGGGVACLDNSAPELRNCILWGNDGFWGGDQGHTDAGSAADVRFCAIQGGTGGFAAGGAWESVIDTDPQFSSPTPGAGREHDGLAADWSLQTGSPCIDAGSTDTTGVGALDLDGRQRITNDRIDVGALEYAPVMIQAGELRHARPMQSGLATTARYDLRGRRQQRTTPVVPVVGGTELCFPRMWHGTDARAGR